MHIPQIFIQLERERMIYLYELTPFIKLIANWKRYREGQIFRSIVIVEHKGVARINSDGNGGQWWLTDSLRFTGPVVLQPMNKGAVIYNVNDHDIRAKANLQLGSVTKVHAKHAEQVSHALPNNSETNYQPQFLLHLHAAIIINLDV